MKVGNRMRRFFRRPKTIRLKQDALTKLSLIEIGVDPCRVSVEIDHVYGTSTIQGQKFGLVFPQVYFQASAWLKTTQKTTDFFFDGFPGTDGKRRELLAPFSELNSVIR